MNPFAAARGAALIGAILGTCSVGAAAGNDPGESLRKALAHCAAIKSSDDRLACYDALAPGLPTAQPSTPASSPPPAAAAAAAKEDFGLSNVQKQKVRPQKQVESIKASVSGLGRSAIGRVLVELDNGQSWELDDADPLLAAGNVVTIQRGALGSFILKTPTGRTHHVRRTH